MLVGFNKKEVFWENIKRDWARGELDCYEIRLEEFMNPFTNVTRKYWKNQRSISARSRRTKLFQSEIFKKRRSSATFGYKAFGNRKGTFTKKVLYMVRSKMLRNAGYQISGVEWEETLLYAMASNGDYFGTGMMKFNEKMLYKNFLNVIEIPPIAKLDAELMFDIKFYARFLAIYLSKMKKDWARIDSEMSGKGMKKAQVDYVYRNILKWDSETAKRNNYLKKHPECDDSVNNGLCETCKEVYKDKMKKRFQKKRKKKYRKLWGICVPLSNYKGSLTISQKLVQERRRSRYEEERYLYEIFVINQRDKEEKFQATVKDKSLKVFYGKPYERKYDDLDCGRDT
jgi:hypothetical protein